METSTFTAIAGQGLIIAFATLTDSRPDNPVPSDPHEGQGLQEEQDASRESAQEKNIKPEHAPTDPDSPDFENPEKLEIDESDDEGEDVLIEDPHRDPEGIPDRNIGKEEDIEEMENPHTRPNRDGRSDNVSEDPETDTVKHNENESQFL